MKKRMKILFQTRRPFNFICIFYFIFLAKSVKIQAVIYNPFRLVNIIKMSFKATLDIAVNFSHFRIKQFHKIGAIRYETCIYYTKKQQPIKTKRYAFPYNIVQAQQKEKAQNKYSKLVTLQEAFIHSDHVHYCSRLVPVKHMNRNFLENTTCYFKIYIDTQIIEDIQCFIEVKLVHFPISPTNKKGESQLISTFTGRINKNYNIFTYLPISFDPFESVYISSTYHAVVSQFKFSSEEDEQNLKNQLNQFSFFTKKKSQKIIFDSFKEYLDHITQKFTSNQIRTFYNFYKNFLSNSYSEMIQRYNKFIEILSAKKLIKDKDTEVKQKQFQASSKVLSKFQEMFNKKTSYQTFQKQKTVLADLILEDLSNVSKELYRLSIKFNQIVLQHCDLITSFQHQKYKELVQERYKNNIFSHQIKSNMHSDFTFSKYDDSGKSHIQYANKQNQKRSSQGDVWIDSFHIEDMSFLEKQQKNVKMFQEVYTVKLNNQLGVAKKYSSSKQVPKQAYHIIFLVHGFQASKCDLLLMKYCLEAKYRVHAIISTSNVGKTEDDIDRSGERLSQQVKKICNKLQDDFKLSFIGHSMGGLIVKSALMRLQGYKEHFHTYISICTPHLGYLYEPSRVIKFGLWLLEKMQKCDSLNQIEMRDHSNLRRTLLYRLTENNLLGHFKNISFVASSQDEYVPYESARVQKSACKLKLLGDDTNGKIINEMVDNMLKDIRAKQISRIDVVFNIEQKNFDSMIGRTGHVKFLSDQQFIKQFIICFKKFFI